MSRRIPEAHAQSPSDAANGAKGDEWDDAQAAGPLRDKAAENRALALIAHYFGNCASLNLSDEKNAGELLFGGLVRFRELGEVYTTPAFDRLITEKKPRTTLGLSLAGNLISLDVSSDDLEPAELAALLRSYRKRKRYHRLRSGAYLSMEDLDIHELDHLAEDLGLSPKDIAQGHIELPTYRAFYLDREFADAKRDESFRSYIERFHAIDQTSYAPPDSLASVLRPYQLEGFAWLSALTDLGFGGILADEMGLGKSVQLISLLLARREQAHAVGASLIVCPASLVYNWLAEFSTFAPMLNVTAVEGGKTARRRIYAQADTEVFVVSYDLARRDIDDIQNMHFYCCVLDEAQYIKNHATLTTRAIKRIDATHRLALTGTPIENRLSEIWSIFDFLMPGFLGTYEHFRRRYEAGILGGDEQAANRLGSLVGPFILRRQKSDVLPDLPEKIESVTYVALAGEQRKVYNALEQQLRTSLALQKKEKFAESKVEVLAELTRLRQAALDPALLYENYRGDAAKTAAIVDLIEQACDAGEKTLVFSQFTSYLSTLADKLAHRGLAYFTITGATPKKQRLAKVNAFNQDDTPVFLVSLKAGGTGLNLTGASVVIHADPWWNAAAVDQATDRAHRIGQQHVVNVYKVIAKDTIEERILKLQLAKVELADAVVGRADALSLSSLTREELVNLLSG